MTESSTVRDLTPVCAYCPAGTGEGLCLTDAALLSGPGLAALAAKQYSAVRAPPLLLFSFLAPFVASDSLFCQCVIAIVYEDSHHGVHIAHTSV